ncbi:MAG: bifunctional [glutamate--ammonia ligase]-adenylyl-L-tyrosine phosphorylase/[glutamate--ammonia-ligase] adenylyltransferase [Nitrosomonadaceae bacterium]
MHPTNNFTEEKIRSSLTFSRYAQRLLGSEPGLWAELIDNIQQPFQMEKMQAYLNNFPNAATDKSSLYSALRNLRKRVILNLVARDLSGLADLSEVMVCMTNLAEVTICFSLKCHQTWLVNSECYGMPKGNISGTDQEMLVIAMGKLGGGELNVSSDVDLIFCYPEDGETSGEHSISNNDFFARLGRKLISSLNDITADGYVFRVDMRLRPYGENGPLVMSFSMLEEYLVTQGREWERYAWIKSRILAGSNTIKLTLLEQIIQPFIFRKYLDFGAYESMREMHSQIRQEVSRREIHDDIKLGPGGIREIEFIAQVFQLIRGGRNTELRIRPTLAVLRYLREKKKLAEKTVTELTDAYIFLRNLEHRLQYLDDQQTQTLPNNSADQLLIASAMDFTNYDHFLQKLDTHRINVTRYFEQVFTNPNKSEPHNTLTWLWNEQTEGEEDTVATIAQLGNMGFSDPDKILVYLQKFRNSTRYRQLPVSSRKRINVLIPILIEVSVKFPPADATLKRILQLLESISGRASYLSLLLENPQALERIAKLVSVSQWACGYLMRHPILLDELLNETDLQSKIDWSISRTELLQLLKNTNTIDEDDTEHQMDVLRHFHHSKVFQLLAKDLEELLPLETLSDHLTSLADLILDIVLRLAWSGLISKYQDDPVFAIIGYGKLGGKELGYASDLDIIFLYDDSHPDASKIYATLGKRINSWLTSYTSAGLLYKTDLRLRPNGISGLLVSSVEAFREYQKQQAWVWEHQALTRARFVAGDPLVGEDFEQIREEVLCQQRNLASLKNEILIMRQKMLDSHPNPTQLFDIKHDRGGIIDVEFIVQYLVLGYAYKHSELTNNIGNIGLLKLSGELGLISKSDAEAVLEAYREFRRIQHRLRLNTDSAQSDNQTIQNRQQKFARIEISYLEKSRISVLQLWGKIFGV